MQPLVDWKRTLLGLERHSGIYVSSGDKDPSYLETTCSLIPRSDIRNFIMPYATQDQVNPQATWYVDKPQANAGGNRNIGLRL